MLPYFFSLGILIFSFMNIFIIATLKSLLFSMTSGHTHRQFLLLVFFLVCGLFFSVFLRTQQFFDANRTFLIIYCSIAGSWCSLPAAFQGQLCVPSLFIRQIIVVNYVSFSLCNMPLILLLSQVQFGDCPQPPWDVCGTGAALSHSL